MAIYCFLKVNIIDKKFNAQSFCWKLLATWIIFNDIKNYKLQTWTKKPNFAKWGRYFALDKTCNNLKFQAIFVIICLAGKDEKNKIINTEEIRKHGKSPWRFSKYKWDRKCAFFSKYFKILYIFAQTCFSLFAHF